MKAFVGTLCAEWAKHKKDGFWPLHLVLGLLSGVALGLYGVRVGMSPMQNMALFLSCMAAAFSFAISLSLEVMAQGERGVRWQYNLMAPSRRAVVLAQGAWAYAAGLVAVMVAGLAFAFTVWIGAGQGMGALFFGITLLLWLTMLAPYAIGMAVAFACGRVVSLAVGGGALIVAALMQTGMGDGIWPLVPYSYGGRLSQLVLAQSMGVYHGHLVTACLFVAVVSCGIMVAMVILLTHDNKPNLS